MKKRRTLLTVTVDRSHWWRGNGHHESYLLRADGMRCCIGFLAAEMGLDDDTVRECDVLRTVNNEKAVAFSENHFAALSEAYTTNDDDCWGEDEREQKLRAIGEQMGVRFIFTGKGKP